jgi:predicted transposase YbfD/YdcC
VKVAQASNEITAVPELLKAIEIEGAVVTVDALNTQKESATQIRRKRADYVMALKGNHAPFAEGSGRVVWRDQRRAHAWLSDRTSQTIDKEHGRIEQRNLLARRSLARNDSQKVICGKIYAASRWSKPSVQWARESAVRCVITYRVWKSMPHRCKKSSEAIGR